MGNDTRLKTDTFFNLLENIKREFKQQNGRDLTLEDVQIVNKEAPQYSGAFDISVVTKQELAEKAGTIFNNEVAVISPEEVCNTQKNTVANKPRM